MLRSRYSKARDGLNDCLVLADAYVRSGQYPAAHRMIVEAKARLDGVEAAFIEDIREEGLSWKSVGAEVVGGISPSGARQRYERVKDRSTD